MKKYYFPFILLCFFFQASASIVNIPDPIFKAKLLQASTSYNTAQNSLQQNMTIDANANGEIDDFEASAVSYLNIDGLGISNLIGIQYFSGLKTLQCSDNQLTSLNLSGLNYLTSLWCSGNLFTSFNSAAFNIPVSLQTLNCYGNSLLSSLNVDTLVNLKYLSCFACQLASLHVQGLSSLKTLICYNNLLTSLSISGLAALESIQCYNNPMMTSLTLSNLPLLTSVESYSCALTSQSVSACDHLAILAMQNNNFSSLEISNLPALIGLGVANNHLANLNLTGNLGALRQLSCDNNQLEGLDLSACPHLQTLKCQNNMLTSLDLNSLSELDELNCMNNSLITLYLKNNKIETYLTLNNNPTLQYICADEGQFGDFYVGPNCVIGSYCNFTPGGVFGYVQGNTSFDTNSNGCDADDALIPNMKFNISNGTAQTVAGDYSGSYNIPLVNGNYTITPNFENPSYFTVSPASAAVNFPAFMSPYTQNFCIAPNGTHHDLEIAMIPITAARPGFDTTYKLIYKNKGSVSESGVVSLTFNDLILDLVNVTPAFNSQSAESLSWNFSNLHPFETREIILVFNLNSPLETPPVNSGNVLAYNAGIVSTFTDEMPIDNNHEFHQTIVNSFDPNDKTCLEGDVIGPELIGKYVHYLIRFENTGNYPAENVVVKDVIDTWKFDVTSLIPLTGSHPFTTRITNGNRAEFIFENINLPFDNAHNDGYVAFKIKTKPSLVVGDTFFNSANIYFDYNFPIETNTAITAIQLLGVPDFEFSKYFTLYPNPVKNDLNIQMKDGVGIKNIAIYNLLGQLVVAIPDAFNTTAIDVSNLKSGNYFVRIISDKGMAASKFIKE
jgi:hypothetical protein